MEFKITKEQIDKLASLGIQATMKKMFPEAFKTELEIGRWYKSNDYPIHIFFVTAINNNRYYYYGFRVDGKYENQEWYSFDDTGLQKGFELATHEEVESALIAEAKKRGYKKGQRIKSFLVGTTLIGSNNDYVWKYFAEENALSYAGAWVFKDGIWAEILPTEKTIISREKALKILAKKLKVSPENIEIE